MDLNKIFQNNLNIDICMYQKNISEINIDFVWYTYYKIFTLLEFDFPSSAI